MGLISYQPDSILFLLVKASGCARWPGAFLYSFSNFTPIPWGLTQMILPILFSFPKLSDWYVIETFCPVENEPPVSIKIPPLFAFLHRRNTPCVILIQPSLLMFLICPLQSLPRTIKSAGMPTGRLTCSLFSLVVIYPFLISYLAFIEMHLDSHQGRKTCYIPGCAVLITMCILSKFLSNVKVS